MFQFSPEFFISNLPFSHTFKNTITTVGKGQCGCHRTHVDSRDALFWHCAEAASCLCCCTCTPGQVALEPPESLVSASICLSQAAHTASAQLQGGASALATFHC